MQIDLQKHLSLYSVSNDYFFEYDFKKNTMVFNNPDLSKQDDSKLIEYIFNDADHEMSLAEIVKNANEGYGKEWKPQTVSTYLAKLCLKNYIQMKRAGRTITYEILITEEDYKSEQAREFVAFWNNGSLKQFITAFYKDEPASKDEIEELRNAIEELEE